MQTQKLASLYQPLSTSDHAREEFARQLAQCNTCPHRTREKCRLSANTPVTLIARKKTIACPLSREGVKGGRGEGAKRETVRPLPHSASPPLILETERIAREVTIGIVAFRRPRSVERLYRSIRRHYPTTRILIADNGDQPAELPEDPYLETLTLEFDAGLSASRNAIVDRLETPYLMLCDDDYEFRNETRIGDLLDVLDADSDLGVAGGILHDIRPGMPASDLTWTMDLAIENGRLVGRHAASSPQKTPAGNVYYKSDTLQNFALFRRAMLAGHRWDPDLKIQEHAAYYLALKQHNETRPSILKWQAACVETCRANHIRDTTPEYNAHRGRNEQFYQIMFGKFGISGIDAPHIFDFPPRSAGRPNIVVLGIGHSGTSILTKILHALGWHPGDADGEFGESVSVREINYAWLNQCEAFPPLKSEGLVGFDFDKTIQGGANYRPTGDDWIIITARRESMRQKTWEECQRLRLEITPDRIYHCPDEENGVEFKLRTIERLGLTRFYDDHLRVIEEGQKRLPRCEFVFVQPLSPADVLASLGKPWALKDPRFVETLDNWKPALAPYRPALIWLCRDPAAVVESHARRGETIRGGSYERAYARCQAHFQNWPCAKLRLDFEQLTNAAALFDRQAIQSLKEQSR